jgi:hypothetical protein
MTAGACGSTSVATTTAPSAHLKEFRFLDDTRIGTPDDDRDDDEEVLDERATKLGRLNAGDQFVYVFDFRDDWHHVCTVGDLKIDPLDELGIKPAKPLPYFGWGDIPEQHGRRWADDDRDGPVPADPRRADSRRSFTGGAKARPATPTDSRA